MADPVDIGHDLAQARERRGVSLEQLSLRTKITVPVLQQIERGELAALPGGIYARGMLRAFAHEVGCDAEAIVSRFGQSVDGAAIDAGAVFVEPVHAAQIDLRDRVERRVQRLVATVLVVAGGSLYAWLNGYGQQAWAWIDTHRSGAAQAAIVPPPVAHPVAIPPARQMTNPAPPAANPGSVVANTTPAIPGVAPVIPNAAPAVTTAAPDQPVGTDGRLETFRVALHADGDCWVSATADGQRVLYGLLNAGRSTDVPAAADVVLRIGDPASVRVMINGTALRPLGRPGEAVTVHLTRDNYREWLQP